MHTTFWLGIKQCYRRRQNPAPDESRNWRHKKTVDLWCRFMECVSWVQKSIDKQPVYRSLNFCLEQSLLHAGNRQQKVIRDNCLVQGIIQWSAATSLCHSLVWQLWKENTAVRKAAWKSGCVWEENSHRHQPVHDVIRPTSWRSPTWLVAFCHSCTIQSLLNSYDCTLTSRWITLSTAVQLLPSELL